MHIILNLVLGTILLFLRAAIIKALWLWFIVAQFAGLAPLSLGTAMGLSLFMSVVISRKYFSMKELQEIKDMDNTELVQTTTSNFFVQIGVLLSTLVVSWVIHSMM